MLKTDAEASFLSASFSVLKRLKKLTFDKFVQNSWIGGRVIVIGTSSG